MATWKMRIISDGRFSNTEGSITSSAPSRSMKLVVQAGTAAAGRSRSPGSRRSRGRRWGSALARDSRRVVSRLMVRAWR